jgi:hypothetical protein
MRRHKLSHGKSKRMFRNSASHTHVKNIRATPMRGGIRL